MDCLPYLIDDNNNLTPEAKAMTEAIIEVLDGLNLSEAQFILAAARKGLSSAAIVCPEKLLLVSAEGIY